MGFPKRKTMGALALGAVGAAVVLAVLFYFSNRVIKAEIERALGAGCRIERLSLRWNGVEAMGVHIADDGKPFLDARRVEVRASFLTLFSTRYSISRLSIDGAKLALRIGPAGDVINPFAHPVPDDRPPASGVPRPVDLSHVVITDSAVTVRDARAGGFGTEEITGITARLDNVALPFRPTSSKVSLAAKVKGDIFSGTVRCEGAVDPVGLTGRLAVEASDVTAFTDGRGPAARCASLRLIASSDAPGGAARRITLSDVAIKQPFVRIEEARSGGLVLPVPVATPRDPAQKKTDFRLTMNRVAITDGEVLILDGRVANPPYPIRLTGASLSADSFRLPGDDRWTSWRFSAAVGGTGPAGTLSASGKTKLASLDTDGKVTLRGLQITTVRPYVVKKGEADVAAGTLDMDMNVTLRQRRIDAPTHAVIRNLSFAPGGAKDRFLGIPRALVVMLLTTSRNEIPLDFTVSGSIDDPRFDMRENLVRRFSVSIARKLGVNVLGTGEAVVTHGGRLLRGIGNGIKSLFR